MSGVFRSRITTVLNRVEQQNRRSGNRKPPPQNKNASQPKPPKFRIVRGDTVQVIDNRHVDKGKQGIVQHVLRDSHRIIVEGINVRTHRIKGNPDRGIAGQTLKKEASIPYSMVSLIDPVSNQPTRTYQSFLEDGSKVRVAKKSGAVIPRPDVLRFRKRPINSLICPVSDTSNPHDVWELTYVPSKANEAH